MILLNLVTHFGDSIVLLPLAVALMILLVYPESRRILFYWCAALSLCIAITALLKIYFLSCSATGGDFRSPSGHTSLSILIYGAIGAILALHLQTWLRLVVALITIALITAIAFSRIALGAHNLPETITGLLVGGLCLAWFMNRYRRHPVPRFTRLHGGLLILVLAVALTGEGPATEDYLRSIGNQIQGNNARCFHIINN